MTDESIKSESYARAEGASTDPLRVFIVGAGRAGGALAAELAASTAGLVGIWDPERRALPEQLERVASFGGDGAPVELVDRADVVLLAVPDAAIPAAAAQLDPRPGSAILHLSGALGPDALGDLPAGVHGGCYHPLQAFRGAARPAWVPPYAVAVDGDEAALRAAFALAAATGHRAVRVPPDGRAAYHAAAVLASNCMVALQATAHRALGLSGVDPEQRWSLLWPLVAGTVANLEDGDFGRALTGPVVRGDADTVGRNLEALDDVAGELYRALGRAALELSGEGLDEETRARVESLLRSR